MSRTRPDQITLQDVAARAHVSAMTASNVMNGTGRVSAATRDRVLKAVAELGYRPNLAASRLVGSSLSCIGVIYPAADSLFLNALVAAIATEGAARGVQLLFRPMSGVEAGAAEALVRSGAEALLLVPPYPEALAGTEELRGMTAPVAALATAGPMEGVFTVRIDNRQAATTLTRHLLEKGHRRIGVIAGPPNHSDSRARLDGHRAALAEIGLDMEAELVAVGDYEFTSGVTAAGQLLDLAEAPTAIVAANDEMAAGVLWVASQRGLKVPADLAVCGFDDTLLATRVAPTLTTVRQPLRAMAGRAIDALSAAFRNRAAEADQVLEFELRVREST